MQINSAFSTSIIKSFACMPLSGGESSFSTPIILTMENFITRLSLWVNRIFKLLTYFHRLHNQSIVHPQQQNSNSQIQINFVAV